MRYLKGMIVGALALGGLMTTEAGASAQALVAPELIKVTAAQADTATTTNQALPCYWGWHRHWGYHPYGWGWHRHWGYHPYGWGWHRPWGWHRHWGWHRWHRW